jgi:Na+/melibiose symporter-like transporter
VEQALGAMAAGVALTLIQFPKHAKPGHVPETIVDHLALASGPVTILIPLIAAVLYTQYKVTKKSHAETKAWLDANRASTLAALAESPAE